MVFGKVILPPGYRFQPSDKQIIQDYLVRKVQNTLPDVSWFIFEKNIYNYANPFLLFQEIQTNQAFFFTPITKVSSSGGKNANRKTVDGKWKGQKPDPLRDDDKPIGTKRSYTFEWDVPEEKVREVEREKGHWIMHEYSLPPNYYTDNNIKADPEYVLCMIRCKVPIFDVNAVRQEPPQYQPVAKRQRTTDAVPPGNNKSSISPLPAETSTSKFVDLEAAPVLNNVEASLDWVASLPPVFNNVESLLNNGGELSEARFPSAPIFGNTELSEPLDPYVPVPVPAPTSMLSSSMPEFESLNDYGCGGLFLLDNMVPANLNTTTTPDNNFYLSVEELDAATKEDSLFGVEGAVLPTYQSKDYLSRFSLLQQDEDHGDDFAKFLEGELDPSTDEPMMISELGSSDTVPTQANVEVPDAVLPNVSVPVPVPPAHNRSSTSWVPSPLPAEKTPSNFVDLEAEPVFNNVESLLNNGGELSDASAPVFSNAELSEWFTSQPPATDPYVPVPAPPSMLSDFDEFINDGGWGNLFSFGSNDLPAVGDSLNIITTPDNNEWDNLDDLLPTSEDKLNSATPPQDNSHTYCDSRKLIKASDSEAVKISKLGWDAVAYKACFPNFQPMY